MALWPLCVRPAIEKTAKTVSHASLAAAAAVFAAGVTATIPAIAPDMAGQVDDAWFVDEYWWGEGAEKPLSLLVCRNG